MPDVMSQVAHVQGLCLNTRSPQGLAEDHGQHCQCFDRAKTCVLAHLPPWPHLRPDHNCAVPVFLSASLSLNRSCRCPLQTGTISGTVCQPVFPVHGLKARLGLLPGSRILGRACSWYPVSCLGQLWADEEQLVG